MRSKGLGPVTREARGRMRSTVGAWSAASGKAPVPVAYVLLGALLFGAFTERFARVGASSQLVYGAAFALDAASIAALLAPALFRLRAGVRRSRPLPRAVTMARVVGEKGLAGCLGASLLLACRLVFAWPAGWPLACAAATWFALCLSLSPEFVGERRKRRDDG